MIARDRLRYFERASERFQGPKSTRCGYRRVTIALPRPMEAHRDSDQEAIDLVSYCPRSPRPANASETCTLRSRQPSAARQWRLAGVRRSSRLSAWRCWHRTPEVLRLQLAGFSNRLRCLRACSAIDPSNMLGNSRMSAGLLAVMYRITSMCAVRAPSVR